MRRQAARRFLGEMTARRVSTADLIQRGMLARAAIPRIHAAIAKAAAVGPGCRGRYGTWNGGQPLGRAADARHGTEQAFRVFHEIRFFEWETGKRADIAYMIDQSHNLKGKIEAMIQTVVTARELVAKAAAELKVPLPA